MVEPNQQDGSRQADDLAQLAGAAEANRTTIGRPQADPLTQATYGAGAAQAGGGSLILSLVGAGAGAAVGAGIWTLVAVVTGYEIGYIACLVGAMAGWGAVLLGRRTGPAVGVIAAVLGVAGIMGGSYGSFLALLHGEQGRKAFRQAYEREVTSDPEQQQAYAQLSESEKKQFLNAAYEEHVLGKVGYLDSLTELDSKDTMFMILFGVLGLYYGYRVGSGTVHARKAG